VKKIIYWILLLCLVVGCQKSDIAYDIEARQKHVENATLINFSSSEPWGRWSESSYAVIAYKKELPRKLRLYLYTVGLYATSKNAPIYLTIGGESKEIQIMGIKGSAISAPIQEYQVDFKNISKGATSIKFDFPSPKSPYELGLGDDKRLLGMGLVEIKIRPIED